MPAMVWKGYISFGLVSFPVQLRSAGRAEAIHFHMLHRKDLSRVKEVWYCAEEDKPIGRSDMVNGYETGKGQYIVVDPEDLKAIAPPTASTMDIIQFVRESDVDPIYFERSYYVAPGDQVGKPYALFVKALQETKYSAIAKVTMHGREHVVLIRTAQGFNKDNLVLHTLFYSDELHPANKPEVNEHVSSSRKELDLATALIRQLAAPFHPEHFHDTYRENVEKLIERKRKGQKITVISSKPKRAPVIDLAEALRKSLTKPAATTKSAAPAAKPKSKPARRTKVA
jgi:DNA end-binding protein Ku